MSIPSADHELHRGHTLAGLLSCKTLFVVNSELWTWSNQTGSRYHAQDDLMFLSALYLTCRWGNLQLWPESHMKAKSFLSEHIPGNLKGTLNLQQCNPEATHCTNNKCFLKDDLHWSSFLHFKHMRVITCWISAWVNAPLEEETESHTAVSAASSVHYTAHKNQLCCCKLYIYY